MSALLAAFVHTKTFQRSFHTKQKQWRFSSSILQKIRNHTRSVLRVIFIAVPMIPCRVSNVRGLPACVQSRLFENIKSPGMVRPAAGYPSYALLNQGNSHFSTLWVLHKMTCQCAEVFCNYNPETLKRNSGIHSNIATSRVLHKNIIVVLFLTPETYECCTKWRVNLKKKLCNCNPRSW